MEINDSPPYSSSNIIGNRRGIGETLSLQSYVYYVSIICFRIIYIQHFSFLFNLMRRYSRYARRSSFSSNRDKYSKENIGFSVTLQSPSVNGLHQSAVPIVPSTTIQGMRKVKHIRVSLTQGIDHDTTEIYWAIVYVPQGMTPNPLFSTSGSATGSLYEPNQFVMNCGIVDPTAGPIRFSSPLSRNLNSGDSIYLIVGSNPAQPTTSNIIVGVASYAITLQ